MAVAGVMLLFHQLLLLFLLLFLSLFMATATSSPIMPKPDCPDKCGNIPVPYPFGLGTDPSCYREGFQLLCNHTFTPPKLVLPNAGIFEDTEGVERYYSTDKVVEVEEISLQGQLRVYSFMNYRCYDDSFRVSHKALNTSLIYMDMRDTPFALSDTGNILTGIGCGILADVASSNANNTTVPYQYLRFRYGCYSQCKDKNETLNGTYPGMGHCQTNNTKGLKYFYGILNGEYQFYKNFSPCAYSFVADYKWYNFSIDHLSDFGFYTKNRGMVPTILDWAIENDSCKNITMRNTTTYACGKNSRCHDSHNGLGYLCECLEGYQGNPYLQDGCQDINECSDSTMNDCLPSLICKNTAGSYNCSCPSGTEGDGRRNGTGCIPIPPPPPSQTKLRVIQVSIGIAIGILFVLSVSSLLYWRIKIRRMNIRKEKCFQQNGGLLLRQQLSSYDVSVDIAKIFTEEELKRATNNYDENLILGCGGYGTVYKGILPNNKIVAIKKSKIIDESQVEQFINEVVILSQINHINVVKFLGCCLESEVPLLVYEFITSGTLFHHIHDEGHRSSLSWDNRLRIAAETASALAYMHFAASPPIFHRDIKSTNILLDDNYTAKVSDFGASRLVPLDQTQFTTLVQGTMGYLDPEYFHTSRLTEKSDVYSFGIVLAELLTGRKALEFDRPEKEKSLALHFISSMKEENILDILEDRVLYEANEDQLREVAKLVERCLSVKGEERPTMKEVAMELEGLRRSSKHLWDEPHEEVECLLGDPPNSQNFNTTNYDSLGNQVVISLDCGR